MGTESRSGHGRGRRRPVSITAVGAFVVALLLGGATVLAATPAHAAALPANAGRFVAVAPSRVYDSRAGAGVEKLGPDGTVRVVVTGRAGVPATGVVAVAVNLTATDVEGEGFLSVYPGGRPRSATSSLNVVPGDTRANPAVTPVGTVGTVEVYSSSRVHVVVAVAATGAR